MAISDPEATVDTLRQTCDKLLTLGKEEERLIEALLTLASSEQEVEDREVFDLAEVAGNVLMSRRHEAERRDVQVEAALAAAPTTVTRTSWSA